MKHVASAIVILSVGTLTGRVQPSRLPVPPSSVATFVVTGRVVADDTGDPLPNARVTTTSIGVESPGRPVVLTDASGRFSLSVPATGRAWVGASKSRYGHRDSDPIQRASEIELRLPRGAAIV